MNPFKKSTALKYRTRALIIFVLFVIILFLLLKNEKQNSNTTRFGVYLQTDTMVIDMSGWDSIKIDSFMKASFYKHSKEDDFYIAYRLDSLDSTMNINYPLADSLLKKKE